MRRSLVKKVVALLSEGKTPSEVAAALDCCSAYVRGTAYRQGIAFKKGRSGAKPTPAQTWAQRIVSGASAERRAALVKALAS